MIYDVIEVLLRRLSLRAREVYDEIEKLDERASREGTSPEEVDNDEAGRRSMSEDRKLRELRQEKGWSVEELAEHSGVDEDIIRAIERDRWYREYDGMPYTPEEAEVIGRLMAVFGVEGDRG